MKLRDEPKRDPAEEETLLERQQLAKELAAAEAKCARDAPIAEAAYTQACSELEAAQAGLQKAQEKRSLAHGALASVAYARDQVRARVSARMIATASPKLHARIDELFARFQEARNIPLASGTQRNTSTGRHEAQRSNASSLRAHIQGLRAAIDAVEALRLEPLTEEQVDERLARIEAGIPDPHLMVAAE